MQQSLECFFKALRGMEVPVSVDESIDAHRAAALVGWSDRALLRDALAVAVAKSEDGKARYFECFDAFFSGAGRGEAGTSWGAASALPSSGPSSLARARGAGYANVRHAMATTKAKVKPVIHLSRSEPREMFIIY